MSGLYEFGAYRLDAAQRLLTRGGESVVLAPKTFDLLLILVESQGQLLTKKDLMNALWPDTFVDEANLPFQISTLRKALGEDGANWIETLPKHGYRLRAPVNQIKGDSIGPESADRHAESPEPAPSPGHTRRNFLPWLILAAVALAGIPLAVPYFRHAIQFAWRGPENTEPLRAVPLTTFPGVVRNPSFSPDGDHVTFWWNGPKQDNPDIYVQQIGAGSPLRLTTDPRFDYNPVWSPDGRWIAFLRGAWSSSVFQGGKGELLLIPPLGGPERKLTDVRPDVYVWPPHLAWCPDSNCLVVTDSTGEGRPDALFIVSLETGEKRQLTKPQAPVLGDSHPALSSDGRSLAFRRTVSAAAGELYLLHLASDLTVVSEPRRLTPASLNAAYPTWMPDGKEILFSAKGSLWRMAVPGESRPERLPFVGEDGLMPVVSRPQPGRPLRLVYAHSFSDVNIWRVETSATGVPAWSPPNMSRLSSTRLDMTPQFSPDGRRVAFGSERSGEREIWLADADGSNAAQLTSMAAPLTGSPQWSSDGQLIAFDSNLEGHYEVYAVPAAGGKPRRVTYGVANNHVPSFSRDGKWIYFSSNRTGEDQIWKVPVSGGEAIQVTHNIGYVAFDFPDGAYVYYTQTPIAPSALWRLPSGGGQPVKVLDGVVSRAFFVLEKGIYYIDQPAGEARLQFFDFAAGRSTIVARNLGRVSNGLTASRDGRAILYTRVDSSVDDLMLVENFR